MIYYDNLFENLGPHISGDISMDSTQLYLSNIGGREACYTGNSLADIQSMMSLDYHSQQCFSRTMAEVEYPFLSSTGKFSVPNFNETDTSMWTGIIFTSHFHDIYCLSFRLKCEGMNFVADNFKFLKNIGDINMIITKMNSMFACPKECLSRCRDILQQAFKNTDEYFQSSPLQMIPQVHNQTTNSMQKKISTEIYDASSVYCNQCRPGKIKLAKVIIHHGKNFKVSRLPDSIIITSPFWQR